MNDPFRDDHSLLKEVEWLRERVAWLENQERARISPPVEYSPPEWNLSWWIVVAVCGSVLFVVGTKMLAEISPV